MALRNTDYLAGLAQWKLVHTAAVPSDTQTYGHTAHRFCFLTLYTQQYSVCIDTNQLGIVNQKCY